MNMINEGVDSQVEKSYLTGLLGALIGAVIGAIPWAIAYYFGWFVGWLGFLIGICAIKGYKIFKGKIGFPAVLVMIFSIIFGVVVGQIMGDFIELGVFIADEGAGMGMTYFDIPQIYFFVLLDDTEMLSSTLANLGIGFLFAGLGTWGTIKDMIFGLKNEGQKEANAAEDVPSTEAIGIGIDEEL